MSPEVDTLVTPFTTFITTVVKITFFLQSKLLVWNPSNFIVFVTHHTHMTHLLHAPLEAIWKTHIHLFLGVVTCCPLGSNCHNNNNIHYTSGSRVTLLASLAIVVCIDNAYIKIRILTLAPKTFGTYIWSSIFPCVGRSMKCISFNRLTGWF